MTENWITMKACLVYRFFVFYDSVSVSQKYTSLRYIHAMVETNLVHDMFRLLAIPNNNSHCN
jgi:hypothetical protein